MIKLRRILEDCQTIAVLGASAKPHRAGHYVGAYLADHGYAVLPVNPALQGQQLFGQPVVATLAELDQPVDMVDVFRRSEFLADHLPEILGMEPLPRVVWFQLGVHDEQVARTLEQAGITVVRNRCTMADHAALGIGRGS